MKLLVILLSLTITQIAFARSYVIFSMAQDLPMGFDNEVIRKNYYVNLGASQGIKKDSILDVFRIISIQNPYFMQIHIKSKLCKESNCSNQ
jgi:hypothetical protein